MATLAITTPVVVRDNGVRSFIPPTFCFELVTANCEIVDTVSAVSLQGRAPPRNVEYFDAAKYLSDSALMALVKFPNMVQGPRHESSVVASP